MKHNLNIRNIIILIVALAVLHFGIGLGVSPMASSFVISQINKAAAMKISVERVNVWPLTLSMEFKDLKVFEPEKPDRPADVERYTFPRSSVKVIIVLLYVE